MFEKLLIIFCRFNYHSKIKLVDVKMGFGPSDTIETVECQICKKVYVRGNKSFNPRILIIVIVILLLVMLFF